MKAAYIEKLGPPENILFGDLPKPVIRPSQALVKVAQEVKLNCCVSVMGRVPWALAS